MGAREWPRAIAAWKGGMMARRENRKPSWDTKLEIDERKMTIEEVSDAMRENKVTLDKIEFKFPWWTRHAILVCGTVFIVGMIVGGILGSWNKATSGDHMVSSINKYTSNSLYDHVNVDTLYHTYNVVERRDDTSAVRHEFSVRSVRVTSTISRTEANQLPIIKTEYVQVDTRYVQSALVLKPKDAKGGQSIGENENTKP